jgi:hypothetical protein
MPCTGRATSGASLAGFAPVKAVVSARPQFVDLREYLYAWNDWIVDPVFGVIAIYLVARYRSKPTLLMATGLTIHLLVKGYLRFSDLSTLDPRYLPILTIGGLAFATASAGFVWFIAQSAKARRTNDPR